MFRDAQEELKRLEAQLLAEEPEKKEEKLETEPEAELTEAELDQIRQLLKDPEPVYEIRNFANQYGATEEATEEAPTGEPRQLSSAWIIALAALVLAAVVGAVAWWLLWAGGMG